MRIFDYSFLESLILPENLSALLQSLKAMQALWEQEYAGRPLPASCRETSWGGLASFGEVFLAIGENYQEWAPTSDRFFQLAQQAGARSPAADPMKKQAVEQALAAYFKARERHIDPLLIAPCLALDLICLSPLPAASLGGALLTVQLLLCREGYTICRYSFLPDAIESYRAYYGQEAALAAQRWSEYENDYLAYVTAFLSLFYLSARKALPLAAPIPAGAEASFPQQANLKKRKPAATRRNTKRAQIEELVLGSTQPVSKAEICAALPQISPTTVEAALGAMVKSGTVKRIGSARTAKYIKN